MRKSMIAANFKMNKNIDEAITYIKEFSTLVKDVENIDIVIGASPILLYAMKNELKTDKIELSAQNVHWKDSGAFTAETSAKVVKSLGINYTILGHSERRQYFCETDETLNLRVKNALNNDLKIIFCIGETLEEREANKTIEKVSTQLKEGLKEISIGEMKNISIAYEPIWAIGTGVTATPEQAQNTHKEIRTLLKEMFDQEIADSTRILYGGSVKPANVKELMSQEDIDGALVGGASLKPESFIQIVKFN